MLDGNALDALVEKHQPDLIIPEIEAIRTERFYDYEHQGYNVVPSAKAANFTMNRKSIRDLAAKDLNVRTAPYSYAKSLEELKKIDSEPLKHDLSHLFSALFRIQSCLSEKYWVRLWGNSQYVVEYLVPNLREAV